MANMKDSRFVMGDIGEAAVARKLKAQRTDDWYDSEKDGMVGNKSYEVKTVRLNGKTKGFWVDKKHWNKADNVDMLWFVRVPEAEDEIGKIYLCHNHKTCWQKAYTNYGDGVRSYPLVECVALYSLSKKESLTLYELSKKISKHKRNVNNDR